MQRLNALSQERVDTTARNSMLRSLVVFDDFDFQLVALPSIPIWSFKFVFLFSKDFPCRLIQGRMAKPE